jgi:hypothetical protein
MNRFQKIDRLSNRRLWISKPVKGSLSAWRPAFQKDSTSSAQVFCRKRHVCAGWCRSESPCTPVHTENFFDLDPFGRAQRGKYRGPYRMARLYVVAFSKQHRRVRHLANPLRCAYNPDSPLGAPPLGLNPSSVQLSSLRERTAVSSAGHTVIFEHEHFRGRVPSQDGQADRGKTENAKFAKFEISKFQKTTI